MVLAGLLKPKKGSVKISGIDVRKIKKLTKKVGFLFQNPDHQLFCDTVESEIAYGLDNGKSKAVKKILKDMNLKKFGDKHPHTLSRGERQRVAIASILILQPDILILDEPTTGLDWAHITQFLDLILNLNANGKTIILISHDMRVIAEYCRRVIVMNEGNIILDDETRNVFSKLELLKKAQLKPPPISELTLKSGIDPPLIKVSELETEVI